MKILELNIKGFRSLKDVTWQPGDLNVIIGPNGSGKSNLLRFLELISVSAQGRLGKYIQSLGGMAPIVWDGQTATIIFSLKCEASGRDLLTQKSILVYDMELARVGQGSYYRLQKEVLTHATGIGQGSPSAHILRTGLTGNFLGNGPELISVRDDLQLEINEEESLLSTRIMGMSLLTQKMELFLRNWKVYHDVDVSQTASLRQAALARPERLVDADGQNLIQVLHTHYNENRDFKNDINEAMRAAFGSDFEELLFPPAADNRIQMRVRWKSLKREQSAADLSDGTLRFLLLLTVLTNPWSTGLIAIDEPENGLHPSMLPIIAEYAVEASKRTQVIFTTHSPQFLDAFTDTKPTTTIAQWREGETILKNVQGELLDYWLQEYSLGALFRSGELEAME